MIIEFEQHFNLPIEVVFSYFKTPQDWARLYGVAGELRQTNDGWQIVPLKHFPFPLVAKNVACRPNEHVHWVFRDFWKGEGVMNFYADETGVTVKGYERITMRWLPFISRFFERIALEKRFRGIWELGWRRLRKQEVHP